MDTSSTDSDEGNVDFQNRKRKKGLKSPQMYKKNVIKQSKVKGLPYISHSGKQIHKRTTGPHCNCRMKCFDGITEADEIDILTKVNDMDTKNIQDTYLQSLMDVTPVARKRSRGTVRHHKRVFNVIYNVIITNTSRKTVCKKAFLSLHGVSDKRVRRLAALRLENKLPKDRRGGPHHALPAVEIQRIDDHIQSFPTKHAHYSNRDIQYLDARLNIAKMYRMFKDKYPDSVITYHYYRNCFAYNHSLWFGRPQIDVCSTCEGLSVKIKSPSLNDVAKRTAAAEMMVHKQKAKKFYSKIEEISQCCKDRDDAAAITFDYMQNLPLPNIPVQEIFYYRQLWVYCFCIHNLESNTASFYTYHEGIARRGPDEVCSLLYDYIKRCIPPHVKELHLFSDSCPGQNRNHTVVRFLLALCESGRFTHIYQYFPVRGHTFLACDRDFGVVKKKIHTVDRIYVPSQYNDLIATACNANQFTVTTINSQDITAYKSWWPKHYKKTSLSIESRRPGVVRTEKRVFSISEYRLLMYRSDNPGVVEAREFIDGLQVQTFRLKKHTNPIVLPDAKAYLTPIPINDKKLQDIGKVLQYIEPTHMTFYDEIMAWKTTQAMNEDSEENDV